MSTKLTPTQKKAKKLGIKLDKYVCLHLSSTYGADAYEWYTLLDKFFKTNNTTKSSIDFDYDSYDNTLSQITVTTSIPKSDAELQSDIQTIEQRQRGQIEADKKRKEQDAQKELQLYQRLKKKYEPKGNHQ